MIERETVLILGAGASQPYGYSWGIGFVDNICRSLRQTSNDHPVYELFGKLGFSYDEVIKFRDALENCGKDTIDEFLLSNSHLDKIGKCAIAMELIRYESTRILMGGDKNSNWYKYLFTAMTNNEKVVDTFTANRISFITFNYDRSLEQFLFTALKNSYLNSSQSQVYGILKKIPIVHIHGQLGFMPWQDEEYRDYGNEFSDSKNIKMAAKGIITINEAHTGINTYIKARKLIEDAKEVIFLGFGFHPTNIQRLNSTNSLKDKRILATAMGISELGKRKTHIISRRFIHPDSMFDMDINNLLREKVVWI